MSLKLWFGCSYTCLQVLFAHLFILNKCITLILVVTGYLYHVLVSLSVSKVCQPLQVCQEIFVPMMSYTNTLTLALACLVTAVKRPLLQLVLD